MHQAEAEAITVYQPAFFDVDPQPTHCRPRPLSPQSFTTKRGKARPKFLSKIPRNTDLSPVHRGAEMLGQSVLRQSEEVCGVLEAKDRKGGQAYEIVAVQMPRRAAKTTSIWQVLLGLGDSDPTFSAVTTAQDGVRAHSRIMSFIQVLRRLDFEGKRNPANRRGDLYTGKGSAAIVWDHGARIWEAPPDVDSWRGDAARKILVDEAGTHDPAFLREFLASVTPLMDTVENSQLILAGTPGKQRDGAFYDYLTAARTTGRVGIVDYSVSDHEQTILYDAAGVAQLNEALLLRTHPGIGTLTTLEKMRGRFEDNRADLRLFEREYFCRWPQNAIDSALDLDSWHGACDGGPELPARPDRVGLAYDVAPNGSSAGLVAAWRDETGTAHLEVLYYGDAENLVITADAASKKHRAPIGHDSIGANINPAEHLTRRGVRLSAHTARQMQGAAARIAAEITTGTLRHYQQAPLTSSVEGAAWRNLDTGRLFGRKASKWDVCLVVAASLALWQWDHTERTGTLEIITA